MQNPLWLIGMLVVASLCILSGACILSLLLGSHLHIVGCPDVDWIGDCFD